MDRTEIHHQIRELSDKINHLNENLFNSRKIHPVEIDLIKLYVRELTGMTDQLSIVAGIASALEPKQKPVIEKPSEPFKISPEPPVIIPAPVNEVIVNEVIETPELNSGFSISLADDEPVVEENEAVKEVPAQEPKPEIEFIADEPNPTPPPRRHVTIQPPVQVQQPKQPEPVNYFKSETMPPPLKEPVKPLIHLSMEEEAKDAPSINDLFAQQQDKSDHFNKTRRADIKGFKESMDLGERFLFLKELFSGNQEAFDRATEYLSNINSFDEAKAFVEESIRPNFNWLGKEVMVKQFYALLEQRYRA